jgi:hypothetical protein
LESSTGEWWRFDARIATGLIDCAIIAVASSSLLPATKKPGRAPRVTAWNAWRDENPTLFPALSGANLQGANLSNAKEGFEQLLSGRFLHIEIKKISKVRRSAVSAASPHCHMGVAQTPARNIGKNRGLTPAGPLRPQSGGVTAALALAQNPGLLRLMHPEFQGF